MPRFLLFLIAVLGVAPLARGQSGGGESLVFTGLTFTSGAETYSWLSWQPTSPVALQGRTLAIYRKNGNAASASPFSRISVIEPANDTRLVSSLLPVAQKAGQDMVLLNTTLNDLLGDAVAAPSVTVPEKISALLSGAWGNQEQTLRVQVLALQHPAIALCASLAVADKISATGIRTYELRDFDSTAGQDLGVIGRVTLDPANPFVLPAPGAPVEVPDTSAKGNLNASLRWATPNALRDVAPLHHGFNLYRVPAPAATARGWHLPGGTPTAAALAAEPLTTVVNRFPILPQKVISAAEAANPADLTTHFAVDDNNRFQSGGSPFTDNAAFYYFIAARDILGRSGLPSPGRLVRLFDRLAPDPPRNTRVRNVVGYNGTVRDQRFLIEWDLPVLPPGETVSSWFVYRWRSPHEIPKKSLQLDPVTGKPERNLIAVLPLGTRFFNDDGTSLPPVWAIVDEPAPDAADFGKTYYYTVRAADGSVSTNLSGNSAPAWGVLRDRAGPATAAVGALPGGTVQVTSFAPDLTFISYTQQPGPGLPEDRGHLLLSCVSPLTRGLEWAEFRYLPGGINNPIPLGRTRFALNPAGKLVALLRKTLADYASDRAIECRIGTTSGLVSPWVAGGSCPVSQPGKFILAAWNAGLNSLPSDGALHGWRHEAVDPLTGNATDVCGTFSAAADAAEYRIYRRVNDSVPTLITQGKLLTPPTTWKDTHQLAASATVEYFLQTLDANSNPGPLVTQGAPLIYTAALPTPMLEPLKSVLPLTNAGLRVKWFCATAGVERFEIWVARQSGSLPASTGSGLSADLASHPNLDNLTGETAGLDFAVFQTGLARHLTVNGTPEFEALLPVSPGDSYHVMIRAVGPGVYGARAVGAFSHLESSTFSLTLASLNNPVPWPERALPPRADFHPGIEATYLSTNDLAPWHGNAVRIGEYTDPARNGNNTVSITDHDDNGLLSAVYFISGNRAPIFYLYVNDLLSPSEPLEPIPGSILPVALYRVQIANDSFPIVPGDIVQVSPLMEQMAYYTSGPDIVVTDPFIAVLHQSDTDLPRTSSGYDHDILLLDRQPVIRGARYKYLLVRFGPGKEIERVIVTNTVDVP